MTETGYSTGFAVFFVCLEHLAIGVTEIKDSPYASTLSGAAGAFFDYVHRGDACIAAMPSAQNALPQALQGKARRRAPPRKVS